MVIDGMREGGGDQRDQRAKGSIFCKVVKGLEGWRSNDEEGSLGQKKMKVV